MFRAAIVVFMLGSIVCALSSTLPQFVVARIVQGCGGAMMTPVGRLVLLRTIESSELVRAMAWLTIPALIGPMLGPPLGGFITTYLPWHWIFLINVPIGLARHDSRRASTYPNPRAKTPPFRSLGFVLSGLGLSGLVFGLSVMGRGFFGRDLGRRADRVRLRPGGALCPPRPTRANPILDLRLLRIPTYRASIVGGFLFRLGIGAMPFLLPLLLQIGFGLTPFQSGLITFVSAAGAMVMKTTAPSILQPFGFRNVLIFNALISAAFSRRLRPVHARHAAGLMIMRAVRRRLLPLAAIHRINTLAYAEVSRRK